MRNDAGDKMCKRTLARMFHRTKGFAISIWRENKNNAKNQGRGERMMKRAAMRIRNLALSGVILVWHTGWKTDAEAEFREVMETKVQVTVESLTRLGQELTTTKEVSGPHIP